MRNKFSSFWKQNSMTYFISTFINCKLLGKNILKFCLGFLWCFCDTLYLHYHKIQAPKQKYTNNLICISLNLQAKLYNYNSLNCWHLVKPFHIQNTPNCNKSVKFRHQVWFWVFQEEKHYVFCWLLLVKVSNTFLIRCVCVTGLFNLWFLSMKTHSWECR